ncbi:MAG: hypothetical protein A3I61_18240 [Acidobacteria bacterium RIFCSPLOWO2_02_FULL_68_18]|nr:MAG: hypothetical protein A3I61_18240 [Acidobacteria bacterium RIFCSPLOWO2_02_FULL_68_18]OFW49627.1 MAG: hypothetical protein A3G77_16290 [Acidobacteria bacterium RIFCSPLOWO2_12_FULL_68_19]
MISARQRRGRLDGVDPDDGPAEALLVGPDPGREIRQRRLASQLTPELLARRLELAPLPAHPARPGILAQRVDHGPAHAPLGKRLELDAPGVVEPARRVDEADHSVLDEVSDVNRMRHRRGNAAGELLHERNRSNHARVNSSGRGAHQGTSGVSVWQLEYQAVQASASLIGEMAQRRL